MAILGRVQSLFTKFSRGLVTFFCGLMLTKTLLLFFGANLVSGFLGGAISGYILGYFYTKRDQRKLERMYSELGVDYHSTASGAVQSHSFRVTWIIRSMVTFLCGLTLTAVLSVFLGITLVSGFLGGTIAGYIFGTYFTRLDQQKLEKMFDDLSIEYHGEYRKASNLMLDIGVISCLVLMLSWTIAPDVELSKKENKAQFESGQTGSTMDKREPKDIAIVNAPGVHPDYPGLKLKPKPFTGPSSIWSYATYHGHVSHGQQVTIIKKIEAGSYIGSNTIKIGRNSYTFKSSQRCMADETLVETEGRIQGWMLSKYLNNID